MRKKQIFAFLFAFIPALVLADLTALIPESTLALIADETSGVAAKRNLDTITIYHRTRASSQFRQAAELAALKLSGSLAYEALNLVDGKRTVGEIRYWLLAECRAQCRASSGWLEPGDVAAYLAALARIGVVLHENPD